jgi:predicted XRE-type DNA-binding protein
MFEPISLPDAVWRTEAASEALRTRDAAGLLRLAHRHGASQHRIANAVAILQGRVSEILRGQAFRQGRVASYSSGQRRG